MKKNKPIIRATYGDDTREITITAKMELQHKDGWGCTFVKVKEPHIFVVKDYQGKEHDVHPNDIKVSIKDFKAGKKVKVKIINK